MSKNCVTSRGLQAVGAGVLRIAFSEKEVNNMNLTKNLGLLLLGIWLIVTGLLQVVTIQVPAVGTVLALLAIVAGALILVGR
jgi:hypothetical protein